MLRFTFLAFALLLVRFLPDTACAQERIRAGLHAGAVIETHEHRTLISGSTEESITTGMAGIQLLFPVDENWSLIIAPQYSQRNYASLKTGKAGASTYVYATGQTDRLGVPVMISCSPLRHHLIRPYLGAGIEFGMNLSGLRINITDVQYRMDPGTESIREHQLALTQLFGAALLEAGLDIQTLSPLSVLLALRYTQEFGPLLEDPLYTHGKPNNWNIRLGLLYELPL
ncbi:MAG: PorT family protein [Bacteroidia bacterium]|nr:PorT family protein [Bacteroidia bacterium]